MMKRLSLLKAIGASALVAVAALSAGVCHATSVTRYADASKSNDDGYGTSWADAEKTIQAAIADCNGDGIVKVKGFTGGTPTYAEFDVVSGVSVYGGYSGTDDDRAIDTYKTVISTSASDCVIEVPSGVSADTELDGLKITNGIGKLVSSYRYGGGIYCAGSPTIHECEIYSNTAKYGGGIYASSGASPVIQHNIIHDNSCASGSGFGIGVFMYRGECSDNEIYDNYFTSTSVYGYCGGGVYLGTYTTAPIFTGNTITHNGWSSNSLTPTAPVLASRGGGVFVAGSADSLEISGNTITDNNAGSGAGIYASSPGKIINNDEISDNHGYYQGGGVYAGSSCVVENNVISSNYGASGGGIYYSGTGAVCGNTISSNSSTFGGGIYWSATSGSTGTVYSNLLVDNTATSTTNGSGVYVSTLQVASVFANNTIVGANQSAGVYLYNPVTNSKLYNNIVYGTASGSIGISRTSGYSYSSYRNDVYNNTTNYSPNQPSPCTDIHYDPLFVYAANGDYHLDSESACIDEGNDAVVQSGWLDLDENARSIDTPYVGSSLVDIGSYELQDNTEPTFTNIVADPETGKEDDAITITFQVSEPLTNATVVKVNNHDVSDLTFTSDSVNEHEDYTCTYSILSSDPAGYATITISGTDKNGNAGNGNSFDALWVIVPFGYSVDANGVRTVTNPNGTSTVYTYDERYRLKEVKHITTST
ncbi:MAG: right-handed parallel beta-helix repeat-containing protein, partial [Armatimonadetes bacterium]|nr:right-handed parallel beta-helix repeat-containing protein [Armatimonadota bacterium]